MNFAYLCKSMSNVFSLYNMSAWNVQIKNERILHDFHY